MGGGGPARASVEAPKKEEEEEETEISPMMFLANNQLYFDHLFDLLNLDNINKEKVRLLFLSLSNLQSYVSYKIIGMGYSQTVAYQQAHLQNVQDLARGQCNQQLGQQTQLGTTAEP